MSATGTQAVVPLSAVQLDELELLLLGLLGEARDGGPSPNGRWQLRLPHRTHVSAGAILVLTDHDGTPVATMTVDDVTTDDDGPAVTGSVLAGRRLEHGPLRDRRLLARPTGTVVAVDGVPTEAGIRELRRLAARSPVTVVLAVDTGTTALRALQRTMAAVDRLVHGLRHDLPHEVHVVLLSVPGSLDSELGRRVIDALGASVLPGAPVEPGPARSHGLVVMLSGLSGSGKSTIARAMVDRLALDDEREITLLDGDHVRRHLSAGLGFSPEDREINVRRIGWVAALVARHGGIAVCAPIAPYAATRAEVRAMVEPVGRFVLVHVATPLAVCEARDRKGLYARARAGDLPDFTGVSAPYEVPTDADVVLDTSTSTPAECVEAILHALGRPDRGRPAADEHRSAP